jgi:hypothetical protein
MVMFGEGPKCADHEGEKCNYEVVSDASDGYGYGNAIQKVMLVYLPALPSCQSQKDEGYDGKN